MYSYVTLAQGIPGDHPARAIREMVERALARMDGELQQLGVFLLLAIRKPWANRSLIAFTTWSSFAHAAVMGTQALRNMISRGELIGVAILVFVGAALIALAPAKQPTEPPSRRSSYQQH